MKNKLLVRALKLMTDSERKGLKHFIRNPYQNKKKDVIKLFDFIYSFQPKFNAELFTDELAFKAVFPKTEFESKKLSKLLFEVFEVAQEFINLIQNKQEKNSKKMALLQFYFERIRDKEDNRFSNLHKKIKKSVESDFKASESFKTKLKLNRIYTEYLSISDPEKERTIELLEAMKQHHFISGLSLCCDALNSILVGNSTLLPNGIKDFIESVPPDIRSHKGIELWYKAAEIFLSIYQADRNNKKTNLVKSVSIATYFELKELFQLNSAVLNSSEQFNFVVFLNTTLAHTSVSENQYFKEHFNNCKLALEQGYLFVNKEIRGQDFKNIIIVALRSNETAWLENYLKTNLNKIEKKYRNDLYFYGMARVKFANGEIGKAASNITQINVGNIYGFNNLKVSVHILKVQIYYEIYMNLQKKELESFEAYEDVNRIRINFSGFLNRKESELEENSLNSSKKFVKTVRKLINPNTDKGSVKRLILEVKGYPANGIPQSEWLIRKLKAK